MKRVCVLALALIMVNCSSDSTVVKPHPEAIRPAQNPPSEKDDEIRENLEQDESAPASFRRINFKNYSYPTSFRKTNIKLRYGRAEYENPTGGGGNSFQLTGVHYVDLTGDGNIDALVHLNWLACGGSCDGGSSLFYFYSFKRSSLKLLSRFETGSMAYGCGLKSIESAKQNLTLEVFNACKFRGLIIQEGSSEVESRGGKYVATVFTRFVFDFDGRRRVLKKREVLPFPQEDVRNYNARIHIEND